MKTEAFDRAALGSLAVLLICLLGLVFFGSKRGVQLVSLEPEEGATISALSSVDLTFSVPMDRPSAERHFSIDPSVEGEFFWQDRTMRFSPESPLVADETYRIELLRGARALDGQIVRKTQRWSFTVRPTSMLYLSPAQGDVEIWQTPLDITSGEPRRLTVTGGRLFDYAVSPEGSRIVFSAGNELGGLDLWIKPLPEGDSVLLVDCGANRCKTPAWSPDEVWVAYGRESVSAEAGSAFGASRIWTVEVASGQTAALFQNSQVLGHQPSWSPDGSRLAFFDVNAGGIRILRLATGQAEVLPSQMGLVGAWSPDGSRMVFSILTVFGNQASASLQIADLVLQSVRHFFGEAAPPGDYGVPAWSPDGKHLLFGLKAAGSGPGRGLWLTDSSGLEMVPVVLEPGFTLGGYAWDPWGTRFLYQRYSLTSTDAVPEVWVYDLAAQRSERIAEDAWLPAWLP